MNDRYLRIRSGCFNGSKSLKSVKLTFILMLAVILQVQAYSYSQNVTLHEKNSSIEKLFLLIEKQSDYHFLYDKLDMAKAGSVTIDVNGVSVKEALNLCLKDQPLTYQIFNNTIVVKKERSKLPETAVQQQQVQGTVKDEQGQPVPGVSVKIKNAPGGTITDANGKFALAITDPKAVLVFSSIGFTSQEIALNGQSNLTVNLKTESKTLSSVVVIGYGSQRK